MKKLLAVLALLLIAWFGWNELNGSGPGTGADAVAPAAGPDEIARAYESRTSGVEVTGSGVVAKILPDDDDGSPHQRFILELSSGQTVLVAHNVELAPRVDGLAVGDTIEFHGVYEWNPRGGVVHWTHEDPAGRHGAGWLRYQGELYQ
jgi:hypothetical protein